jgi:FliI/YscN family ATPase
MVAQEAYLQPYIARARLPAPRLTGVITRVLGMLVEAVAQDASVGDFYLIEAPHKPVRAEVVALKGRTVVLLPYGQLAGMRVGASLTRLGGGTKMPVGEAQLGRVLDALGHPLDGREPPQDLQERAIHGAPLPLDEREPVRTRLCTGVRALDAFVPLGEGQRIGIFSGPGVGKSTLLGMLAQGAEADVIVLGLIGERGREVGHFVDDVLDEASRKKSVIIAATSDRPASERVRAAFAATTVAEHFRDQGKRVLLFIDSLSRLCMAQRDIGLATGEPPTSKGYPPSSFSLLPRLLERVASAKGKGSLTGVYTVLVEGDDMSEPVADAARGLLDGHVVLSRALATRGHFPAIDVLESLSRLESELTPAEELTRARKVRGMLARIEESRELVSVGAYRAGADPQLDVALKLRAAMEHFLQQGAKDHMPMQETQDALKQLFDAARAS